MNENISLTRIIEEMNLVGDEAAQAAEENQSDARDYQGWISGLINSVAKRDPNSPHLVFLHALQERAARTSRYHGASRDGSHPHA